MGTKGRGMDIWNHVSRARTVATPRTHSLDLEKQELSRTPRSRVYDRILYALATLLFASLLWGLLPQCPMGAAPSSRGQASGAGLLASNTTSPVQKSFEITIETLPDTPPVHSQHLLTYSFGDSWGKPARKTFAPYREQPYNKLVLELVTNVSGTQFDRLAHVFLNDINVWRSSTAEPYNGKTVVSESSKDVSQYMALFEPDEPIELVFQLDNLVTTRLDGAFNVELLLHYYQVDDDNADDDDDDDDGDGDSGKDSTTASSDTESSDTPVSAFHDVFLHYIQEPPTSVHPLVEQFTKTPLLYYPLSSHNNPRWKRPLHEFGPATSHHVSSAVVEVFASGNAAEEFWYTNVLDKYTDRFASQGHSLLGHGPLRVLNIYISNSEAEYLVDSFVPTPVIFTGGLSPPLWRPCVGIDAFDIESYRVNLTPFLSLLVQGGWELEIEVASSVVDEYKSTVGENWILSGNLLLWEDGHGSEGADQRFSLGYGQLLNSTLVEPTFQVAVDDKDKSALYQLVNSTVGLHISSEVRFQNETYVLQERIENRFTSNQTYLDSADVEATVTVLEKLRRTSIFKDGTELIQLADKTSWQLIAVVEMEGLNRETSELTYSTDVVREVGRFRILKDFSHGPTRDSTDDSTGDSTGDSAGEFSIDAAQRNSHHRDVILALQGSQVGKATYTLSPNGNHGSGDSLHSVRVVRSWPRKENYKRDVIVKNNEVAVDLISKGDHYH